jgi:hypothetical protein
MILEAAAVQADVKPPTTAVLEARMGRIRDGVLMLLAALECQAQVSGRVKPDPMPQDTRALPHYERFLLLETTSETSANVSFGDVNKDGHLDIVLARGRHWPLVDRVLLGNGRVDIFVGHVESLSTVYFNNGAGRGFTSVHFGDNKGTVYGFAIGDLDEDGLPDIAAARSEAPNTLYFATRTPRKTF